MTRLASILGVATVATLVLLSGCEAAVTASGQNGLRTHPNAVALAGIPLGASTEFDRANDTSEPQYSMPSDRGHRRTSSSRTRPP